MVDGCWFRLVWLVGLVWFGLKFIPDCIASLDSSALGLLHTSCWFWFWFRFWLSFLFWLEVFVEADNVFEALDDTVGL